MNWFALSAAVIIALIAIIFLLFSVCYSNQQRTYYTNESRGECRSYPKFVTTNVTFPFHLLSESVEANANVEPNDDIKVPLNDGICTIQEKCQPISLLHDDSNYPQSSYYYH